MSYSLNKREMKVLLTKTNNSGNLSANDIVNINTSSIYNNTGCTINSNNIVLQTGYYLITCCIGINNSNLIANYADWNLLIDDVEQSTKGSSTQDNKVGIDGSTAAVFVSSSTKTLKVKITSLSGTCSIDDGFSYIMIKKVDL
jgi:hypothetical protein